MKHKQRSGGRGEPTGPNGLNHGVNHENSSESSLDSAVNFPFALALVSEEKGRVAMWARLNSGDWWTVPFISNRAIRFCRYIEERYYTGPASADFEVYLSASCYVAFAHKRRLTVDELERLVPPISDHVGATRDVLILPDGPTRADFHIATSRALAWSDWMMGSRKGGGHDSR